MTSLIATIHRVLVFAVTVSVGAGMAFFMAFDNYHPARAGPELLSNPKQLPELSSDPLQLPEPPAPNPPETPDSPSSQGFIDTCPSGQCPTSGPYQPEAQGASQAGGAGQCPSRSEQVGGNRTQGRPGLPILRRFRRR